MHVRHWTRPGQSSIQVNVILPYPSYYERTFPTKRPDRSPVGVALRPVLSIQIIATQLPERL